MKSIANSKLIVELFKGKYNFVKQLLLSLHNSRTESYGLFIAVEKGASSSALHPLLGTKPKALDRRGGRGGAERISAERRMEWSADPSDEGQANKSARGMPWHQEPMKDVTSCEKLRGAANKH